MLPAWSLGSQEDLKMTRSLYAWLASIALAIAPGSSYAQEIYSARHSEVYRLAPVALEARCQIADESFFHWYSPLTPKHDPIFATVMEADSRPSTIAPTSPAPFCPFAELAKDEPIDVDHAVGPSGSELTIAQAAPLAVEKPAAQANGVGASPMIVTLHEDYLAYGELTANPLRVDFLPFTFPKFCLLSERPVQERPLPPVEVAIAAANAPTPSQPFVSFSFQEALGPYLAGAQDTARFIAARFEMSHWGPGGKNNLALRRQLRSLQPRLPLDCWMDEILWRSNEVLSAEGPLASMVHPHHIGSQLGNLVARSHQQIVTLSEPALPILARSIVAPQAPAVPVNNQPNAPAIVTHYELAATADLLQAAADELQDLASSLRAWSDSLHRIARSDSRLIR